MTSQPIERAWWHGTSDATVRVSMRDARAAIERAFTNRGVPEADGEITARHLVEASARGYSAHGAERVLQYCEMLRLGTLVARPQRMVLSRRGSVAVIDGARSLGPPAAAEAAELARQLAVESGVGLVALRNAGHLGMLAPWAELCAGIRCFALVVSSTEPGVTLPGGRSKVFGTNPIAFAWPSPAGGGCADFSTSNISRSELLRLAESAQELPPSVAVDELGRPTRLASEALNGALLPIGGGRKGALLCLLAALLAGPVAGGPPAPEVTGTRRPDTPPVRADLFIAIDLEASTSVRRFGDDVDRMFAALALEGVDFHSPGSTSRTRMVAAARDGITISPRTARFLSAERKV